MNRTKCCDCRFAAKLPADHTRRFGYECRYNPPTVALDAEGVCYCNWPGVDGGHWCGKGEPLKAAKK